MPTPRRPSLRRQAIVLVGAIVVALVAGIGMPAAASTQTTIVDAAPERPSNADDFDPGLIVSDYEFFNSDALTEKQVQHFLKTVRCQPSDDAPCLADFTQDTVSRPAVGVGHCERYAGADDESAARIITKVATACGISPRTLIVLLQKEQSLVTRPTARGYLRATGYACPDTSTCDTRFFGFFNQVYWAAWQFRQYTEHPVRRFHIGTVAVPYNPKAVCGSSVVDVSNQATADLYNYTPYQPDDAAIDDLYGEGDACSTHGNLNFWKLWTTWFGDPTAVGYPAIFGSCANLVGGHGCREPEWF